MKHYRSWSDLNNRLSERLADPLKGRISYFLTRYHKVHDSYGRASIMLDKKELASFTWRDMYQRDSDMYDRYQETGKWDYDDPVLKEKWEKDVTFSEMDFLDSATEFLEMNISDALSSSDPIIRILAILDSRVGKRTLEKIKEDGSYKLLPDWERQFYELRIDL